MKEWYLMGGATKPNSIGGYENEAFGDFKGDAFSEALTTDIADDIVIWNHDMTESVQIRGILSENVADTTLKSLQRSVLVEIGTLKGGDYLEFDDNIWIVDGRPGNNHIYEKATLKQCQYKLRWQKNDGTIIERWANFESASKYDVGEIDGRTMILPTNNSTILIPTDENSLTIEGKRVFIDINEPPQKTFKITRNDDVLYLYKGNEGVLSLISDRTELNSEEDRPDLRLCNYIETTEPYIPDPNQSQVLSTINGRDTLRVGYSRTYTVSFTDLDGNEVSADDVSFVWNIEGDITDSITADIDGDSITLTADDDDMLVDEKFKLQIVIDGEINVEMIITIAEAWG